MPLSLTPAQPLLRRSAPCTVAALLLVAAVAGCGNKGPLYLPPEAPITHTGPGMPGAQPTQDDGHSDAPDPQP